MAAKKTWTDKFNASKSPQIKYIDFAFADIPAGSNMYIATPKIIDDYIRQIPEGKTVDTKILRKDLAIEHRADHTCPVTTGIFLRIVAEAAYEQYEKTQNSAAITPFWRVIEPHSPLAKKLTLGTDFIVKQLKKEAIG